MTIPTKYYSVIRRDPNIVGYWRLNEEVSTGRVVDWSNKYGLNGIYDGSPSGNVPLINGDYSAGSKLFGSSGQNVEIPDASPLRITGDITIEVWIVPYTEGFLTMISKMNGAYTFANPYRLVSPIFGILEFSLGNGSSQTNLSFSSAIKIGSHVHIVATCFRKTMSLIINGEEKATKSLGSQEVKDGEKPVFIGALGNNEHRFNGLIGEVALYNAGFSLKKAKRHYEIGKQVLSESAYIKTFDPPSYS